LGLLAVGLILVAEAIHWLHSDMEKAQLEHTKQASLIIRALAQDDGLVSIDSLQSQLNMLVMHTDIVGTKVHSGFESIAAGKS
jgi:hypothetical protein